MFNKIEEGWLWKLKHIQANTELLVLLTLRLPSFSFTRQHMPFHHIAALRPFTSVLLYSKTISNDKIPNKTGFHFLPLILEGKAGLTYLNNSPRKKSTVKQIKSSFTDKQSFSYLTSLKQRVNERPTWTATTRLSEEPQQT